MDEAVQSARLSLSSDLLMFRKSMLTLTGVLREIGGERFDLDQTVLKEFLYSSLTEWPARWLSPPNSRSFATRLSNLDIAETYLSTPMIASRYWQAMCQDFVQRHATCTEN